MAVQKEKIAGALYGAAYGDSFGAMTEFCPRERIAEAFPEGYVEYTSDMKSISHITEGIAPGSVTDDFGSSLYFMKAVLAHGGDMNREVAIEAILAWGEDPVVFGRYAGANSKAALVRLKEGTVIDEVLKRRYFIGANTNGGAMRVAPMGLLARGNTDTAIRYATDLCWPTHYNSEAVAAAAAIACAVNAAVYSGISLDEIVTAAADGAETARRQLEAEGFSTWGPYVDKKILFAAKRGRQVRKAALRAFSGEDTEETKEAIREAAVELLNAEIGTGIAVQESIPAVFAAIMATDGDFTETLRITANAGGDTDTISSMAGAVLGGYHGICVLTEAQKARLDEVNAFLELKETIDHFTAFILEETEHAVSGL